MRILAKDLEFFLDVLSNKGFEIDGVRFPINMIDINSDFDVNEANKRLLLAKQGVELLDLLHCKEDLELSKLTDADFNNFNRLIAAFVKKENILGLPDNIPEVVNIPIGPLKFTIFTVRNDDGTYRFIDFFEMNLYMAYSTSDEKEIPTSMYSVFKAEDIIEINNMRFDLMLSSFQQLKNNEKYNDANLFMLKLIKAFDLSNDDRVDVLNIALEFAEWLKNCPVTELDPTIVELNRLQIIKRLRTLSNEEREYLWELVYSDKINDEYKFASFLLLEQLLPAQKLYDSWDENLKKCYKDYPIYRFYESNH